MQFADLPKNRSGSTAAPCVPGQAHHIAGSLKGTAGQRLTADLMPDNGIVEADESDATVNRYHYESRDQIRHLDDFVTAYNFARRLKTLNALTPTSSSASDGTIEPERFTLNPLQKMPGLNA
jgi:hypothetical protein